MRRIGYRRTADVTGAACFARRHAASLASSGRTRDSIPHGVRSTDSGAKHLRYLGTGCSDRWFPISRTASSSTFLRRRTLRLVVNERCRMRFQESVSPRCRPEIQRRFGHPPISQSARQDAETPRNPEKEIRGCRGDVGNEMQKSLQLNTSQDVRARGRVKECRVAYDDAHV